MPKTSVELRPHNPLWREMASREGERLQTAVGDSLIVVHHIGEPNDNSDIEFDNRDF